MTKFFVFSFVLFSINSALALPPVMLANPQIRACNTVGGQFAVVDSDFEQIGLCLLGPSIVGAIDILNKDAALEIPLSLYNYRKGVMSCSPHNLTKLTTLSGNPLLVCLYSDGSLIDIDTLNSGKASLRNVELNRALAIRIK